MTQYLQLTLFVAAPLLVAAGGPLPLIVAAAIVGGVGFSISAVLWGDGLRREHPGARPLTGVLVRLAGVDNAPTHRARDRGPVAVAIGAPLTMGLSFIVIGLMSVAMLGIRDVRALTRRSIVVSEPVTARTSPPGRPLGPTR